MTRREAYHTTNPHKEETKEWYAWRADFRGTMWQLRHIEAIEQQVAKNAMKNNIEFVEYLINS